MHKRILFWPLVASLAGLLVGCGWVAYALLNASDADVRLSLMGRVVLTVAYITCPVLAFGLRWNWTPLLNAASLRVDSTTLASGVTKVRHTIQTVVKFLGLIAFTVAILAPLGFVLFAAAGAALVCFFLWIWLDGMEDSGNTSLLPK